MTTPTSTDAKLRVLHLTAGSDAGGLSRYIHDLSVAMVKDGHDVAVAGERGAWHWLFERSGLRWVDVPLKRGPLQLWNARRTLEQYLNEHPADVLHVHYRRPMLVARGLQKRLGDLPILYTVHLTDLKMGWPWRLLTDMGDVTHVASEDARRWVTEVGGVNPDGVRVIRHGVHVEKFPIATAQSRSAARKRFGLSENATVGAFVGRLDVPKNESWILDLAHRVKDAVFLIAGEGPHEQEMRARITGEGLGDRVKLLGHVDPLDVYHAADLLLLPSEREGFSLVCAEAMSCGIPVLRTRTSGTTETVIEGITGQSCAINREAFLTAGERMMNDAEALARMGRDAADYVRKELTFDRQYRETLTLYRQLAQEE